MTKQIQDAYIVAATRTPVGKAPKGMFRNTRPDDMLAHVLRSVVAQAPGVDVNRIDDAIIGCAMPEAEQGMNVARIGVLLAGLPNTVAAQTVNRFCSSGLQAVAMAADQIRLGNADLMLTLQVMAVAGMAGAAVMVGVTQWGRTVRHRDTQRTEQVRLCMAYVAHYYLPGADVEVRTLPGRGVVVVDHDVGEVVPVAVIEQTFQPPAVRRGGY